MDKLTSGLQEYNIQNSIYFLQNTIAEGDLTVTIVKHNLCLIGQADWLLILNRMLDKRVEKFCLQVNRDN